ncbi:urea ABC transporter permease subunit UrtB [Nevskia sp.]|uniref:urea ABC transporter permease subunit UrtB n=1 Tax=Nevskia sp. TaxID=1929292 RepID=UPI0025CE0F6C|nr:urea ABC transporter permease subunit UrtB [Nevskia sp.]
MIPFTTSLRRCLLAALIAASLPLHAQEPAAETTAEASAEVVPAAPTTFPDVLRALGGASLSERSALLEALLAAKHPNTAAVLKAWLDDHLHVRDADGAVFITAESDAGYALTDPGSMAASGPEPAEGFSKVGSNNSLRKLLRSALASFTLGSPDAEVRLGAVKEMLRAPDEATLAMLRERRATETDAAVQSAIDAGLAYADLTSESADTRLAAVKLLSGSLAGETIAKLEALRDAANEPDERVRSAASVAISSISLKRTLYSSIETLFFGLSLGSVLVLAAIGLAITFGVMGVINMAHGELMMIGAYTAYVVQLLMPNQLAASILISIPAAFVVSGLVGIAIERGVVKHLYGRPLETLLATFGISLILQQVVRSIFSPLNRSVATPEFMSGQWVINDALSLTWNRIYIVLFTLVVFAALQLILRRTSLGLTVRAVSQNRAMARSMGINSDRVDAITFGLGSGIAGVAGVALSQLTNVGPNLGQSYIIDSFMVVVFGGVGNLWGTLIGGMTLGVAGKLLEPAVGAVMAKIAMLVFIILFIQRRKQGLFPQKGRAAEGH